VVVLSRIASKSDSGLARSNPSAAMNHYPTLHTRPEKELRLPPTLIGLQDNIEMPGVSHNRRAIARHVHMHSWKRAWNRQWQCVQERSLLLLLRLDDLLHDFGLLNQERAQYAG
jgi:hypothetical protein